VAKRAGLLDHDVLGLQVAVYDEALVAVLQRAEDLSHDVAGVALIELALLDDLVKEFPPINEFKHQVHRLLVLEGLVQLADARMVQAPEDGDLTVHNTLRLHVPLPDGLHRPRDRWCLAQPGEPHSAEAPLASHTLLQLIGVLEPLRFSVLQERLPGGRACQRCQTRRRGRAPAAQCCRGQLCPGFPRWDTAQEHRPGGGLPRLGLAAPRQAAPDLCEHHRRWEVQRPW